MGLLSRLRASRTAAPVEATWLGGDEAVEVVGESHYVSALRQITGRGGTEQVRYPVVALLVPEPSNPYDSYAIAVEVDGHKVGYLSRDDARAYGRLVQECAGPGRAVACNGRICGREGTPNLGVWLDLPVA
jgi:hypothetical protein